MIRVLVVDDSTFMRTSLVSLLEEDPEIKVVGTAVDGQDALKKAAALDPDVMTLDVEMPRLDGLATLQELMKTNPLPVLMASALTESGAHSTFKALEYGALDFIPKTMSNDRNAFGRELRYKVKAISRKKSLVRLRFQRLKLQYGSSVLHSAPAAQTGTLLSPCKGPRDLVVIGVSTGGPPVVQKILSVLPGDLPACILIAQHMPATFTGPFAKRLDGLCKLSVSEASDGDKYKKGHAYVCPGGRHIGVRMRGPIPEVVVTEEPRDALYKPSVNVLMETAGKCMGGRTLGVMLTGMGSDGCEGAKVLRKTGGCLVAQSEASCVVYGMPKAVVDEGLANQILDAEDIAQAIVDLVKG
ncbi:MAG: chemotaxis response regulator protein-glutamate methylesterase [Desulfovibrio sp.]|jgi:two-component system chemotaxis response regulator CheB|nr:chemotaxis response regulator protein-glutamate methylesterase [Desulfovibrio sp.]